MCQSVSKCPPASELKLGLHSFRTILEFLDSHTDGQTARQPDGKINNQTNNPLPPLPPCRQQPLEDGRPVPLVTCPQLMDRLHQGPDHTFARQSLFVGRWLRDPGERKATRRVSSNGLRPAWLRVAWNKLGTRIIRRGGVL